jgi:hypothetical protein
VRPLPIIEQRVELRLGEALACFSVQSPAVPSLEIFLAYAPLVVIAWWTGLAIQSGGC